MSLFVFCALLAAAAMHAGWNALVRREGDRDTAALAIAGGGVAVGLAVIPFLPSISTAAIPFVFGSSFIHLAYYSLVARAYRHGELSMVYPIMRGLAPLIVTVFDTAFIEPANQRVVLGILVVVAGIVSLGAEGRRRGAAGLVPALLNAAVIAAYTLVDGLGARASEAPAAYTAWLLVGGGAVTLIVNLFIAREKVIAAVLRRTPLGLAGGAMSYAAYAIALWAMTRAPIGAVAAVRESSVLFATALGALMLRERFGPARWISAALVVVGLALVKLG